jgi:fatty acyl-CoA reductase
MEFPMRGFCRFDNALPAFLRAIAQQGVRLFPEAMRTAVNDAIPVDLCVNQLLAAAVERANGSYCVIHCASAYRNLPTLGEMAEMAGPVEYLSSVEESDDVLRASTNRRAAALNRIVLKMSMSTDLDGQARAFDRVR